MRYFSIALFSIMVIAQWYVPVSMISGQENLLQTGEVWKFKTRPIDPTDPFRGKYITLSFEASSAQVDTTLNWDFNEDIYVVLRKDSAGYASIFYVTKTQPAEDVSYVKAKAGYGVWNGSLSVNYPFNRFYLEESKASEAERLYWNAASDTTQVAYAVVRVRGGNTALQDVMINERSIVAVIREMNKEK